MGFSLSASFAIIGATVLVDLLATFARNGRAVIIVTHNREIARIAHNVLYLRDGKILKTETNENPVNAHELEW